MAKVTGIGGVFFKARDKAALSAWYQQHLGIPLEAWGGGVLQWSEDKANDGGLTVWNLFDADSTHFAPSESNTMINYRVDDLTALLAQLAEAGIETQGGPESHENGKFAWIMDPEGNKVELWEPMAWDDANKAAE